MLNPHGINAMDELTFSSYLGFQHYHRSVALSNNHGLPQSLLETTILTLRKHTGISLTVARWADILSLFPVLRAEVLIISVLNDAHEKIEDSVCTVATQFYLATDWPSKEDNVNMEVFMQRLRQAAAHMGDEVFHPH